MFLLMTFFIIQMALKTIIDKVQNYYINKTFELSFIFISQLLYLIHKFLHQLFTKIYHISSHDVHGMISNLEHSQ